MMDNKLQKGKKEEGEILDFTTPNRRSTKWFNDWNSVLPSVVIIGAFIWLAFLVVMLFRNGDNYFGKLISHDEFIKQSFNIISILLIIVFGGIIGNLFESGRKLKEVKRSAEEGANKIRSDFAILEASFKAKSEEIQNQFSIKSASIDCNLCQTQKKLKDIDDKIVKDLLNFSEKIKMFDNILNRDVRIKVFLIMMQMIRHIQTSLNKETPELTKYYNALNRDFCELTLLLSIDRHIPDAIKYFYANPDETNDKVLEALKNIVIENNFIDDTLKEIAREILMTPEF